MIWTEATIQRLTRLVQEGCTAFAISQIFHTSRNAVAGKVYRLGLKLNKGNGTHGRGSGKRGPNNGRSKTPQITVRVYRQRWEAPKYDIPSIGVQFSDLDDSHCRYVLDKRGDDMLPMYCGLPKEPDKSWCYGHCCEVFKPTMECVNATSVDNGRGTSSSQNAVVDGRELHRDSSTIGPNLLVGIGQVPEVGRSGQ